MLFVSHNMAAVRALCDSCLYLAGGRVVSQGSVDSIIAQYMNPANGSGRSLVTSRHGISLYDAAVYDEAGDSPRGAVHFMEPCQIRVRIGAPAGFAMAALVVHVYDELGGLVSSLNSTEEGIAAFTMGPEHTFVYPIGKMTLMPGRYFVSVLVHRPHDATKYLEADNFFDFEVLPAVLPGGLLPYTRSHGVARFVDGCRLE